ncbi:MAG: glycosyltransferase [Candidatus Omnitrophica bacterium]|nr:glycosyltransferase [Candidatus Omnitrophota bacterium]
MKISLVVPAHNEEENILDLLNKIENTLKLDHELIVVDDHSTDKTPELVRQAMRQHQNIRLVQNALESGFANAIKAGFSAVSTDVVVPIMGDLCDDLSTIPLMLEKITQGYDVVCGSRYIKGGSRLGGSGIKGFLSGLGGKSLHSLLGFPSSDISNAFKMYRKKVIETIKIDSTGFEVSMEIPLKAFFTGFKITEVPTVWRERSKGKSSFKIFKLLPSYLKLYFWAIMRKFKK